MSASGSPGNPGSKANVHAKARAPGALSRLGPGAVIAAVVFGGVYVWMSRNPANPATAEENAINPFRTQGVQNIETAYKNAGATGTHTKAYGGTVQGEKHDQELRGEKGKGDSGTGAPKGFSDEHSGTRQRETNPSEITLKAKEAIYGDKHGK